MKFEKRHSAFNIVDRQKLHLSFSIGFDQTNKKCYIQNLSNYQIKPATLLIAPIGHRMLQIH